MSQLMDKVNPMRQNNNWTAEWKNEYIPFLDGKGVKQGNLISQYMFQYNIQLHYQVAWHGLQT